jgi:antitoxin (DNA-binding transcriptional repressor) of toxin-antitoxin stability system
MKATVYEAKTNLSHFIKIAQTGETVIITSGRDKVPVAKIEGIGPKKFMRLGFLKHLKLEIPDSFFDPLQEEELRLWNEGDANDPLYTRKTRV